ncbi:MAG: hypothetical protein ACI83B_001809 [Sediminicola sp.]|jgi:hypothetical protein
MRSNQLFFLLTILLVGACSSSIDKRSTEEVKKDTERLNKTNITQFEELAPYWKANNGEGEIYLDAYTSLIITSPDHDVKICKDNNCPTKSHLERGGLGPINKYRPYIESTWYERLFRDTIVSTSLTFEMTTPDYSATVPLAIMEYSSSRENGDQWYRMVAVRREAFPLFLIKQSGQNSKAGFKFNVYKSQQANSNAGQLLKTTLDTLSTVTPQLTVVTTLNKHFTESSKEALDKILSANFNKSIKEDLIRDVSLLEITGGSNIQVEFKDTQSDSNFVDTFPTTIGRWQISFDHPRPSVFAAFRICPKSTEKDNAEKAHVYKNGCRETRAIAEQAVLDSVQAADILNFSLAFGSEDIRSFGTIDSFLRQQSWFAEFLSLESEQIEGNADKLCRNIRNSIVGVNLNSFDADLVVYAVIANMPFKRKTAEALKVLQSGDKGVNSCITKKKA